MVITYQHNWYYAQPATSDSTSEILLVLSNNFFSNPNPSVVPDMLIYLPSNLQHLIQLNVAQKKNFQPPLDFPTHSPSVLCFMHLLPDGTVTFHKPLLVTFFDEKPEHMYFPFYGEFCKSMSRYIEL